MDLDRRYVRKDNYPGLPEALEEYNYWIADAGRCIMAIPTALMEEAHANGDLDMFEVPMPVKYVLAKGWTIAYGHVIVEAEYDNTLGLIVPEGYEEW